jgi:hypothetical protein
MHNTLKKKEERRVSGRGLAFTLALSVFALTMLIAGCAPGGFAQSPGATAEATGAPTVTVAITGTTGATPTTGEAVITPSPGVTGTGAVTPTQPGPDVARPTPTGPAPDPANQLRILEFYNPADSLVKRDFIDLNGDQKAEVLFTVTGNRPPITSTQEIISRVAVLSYDDVYREWSLTWISAQITGTAHPLPSANRSSAGGYNGGNILGTGNAIFAARTTARDGRAQLYLWRWDGAAGEGVPLKMQGEGGAETDALFTADLDVNLADINDDGIYEVVADNVADVRVWRWDGAANRFVPEEAVR